MRKQDIVCIKSTIGKSSIDQSRIGIIAKNKYQIIKVQGELVLLKYLDKYITITKEQALKNFRVINTITIS